MCVIIIGLFGAWLLSLFGMDQFVINLMDEWFQWEITSTGYYGIMLALTIFFWTVNTIFGRKRTVKSNTE